MRIIITQCSLSIMDDEKLNMIKNEVQFVIDCISKKDFKEAMQTLTKVNSDLNDLIDVTIDEEQLREISKYQVLAAYLSGKIV